MTARVKIKANGPSVWVPSVIIPGGIRWACLDGFSVICTECGELDIPKTRFPRNAHGMAVTHLITEHKEQSA